MKQVKHSQFFQKDFQTHFHLTHSTTSRWETTSLRLAPATAPPAPWDLHFDKPRTYAFSKTRVSRPFLDITHNVPWDFLPAVSLLPRREKFGTLISGRRILLGSPLALARHSQTNLQFKAENQSGAFRVGVSFQQTAAAHSLIETQPIAGMKHVMLATKKPKSPPHTTNSAPIGWEDISSANLMSWMWSKCFFLQSELWVWPIRS